MRNLSTWTVACCLTLAVAGSSGAFPPGGDAGNMKSGGAMGGGAMSPGWAASKPGAQAVGKITKIEGGQTIEEVFRGKADLSGKDVAVRGQVVKVNSGIMGKTWIHIQDGTGSPGANDLTVTTADEAKVGDVVVVRGKLTTNKNFGSGYKYDVIVEDGKVTKE